MTKAISHVILIISAILLCQGSSIKPTAYYAVHYDLASKQATPLVTVKLDKFASHVFMLDTGAVNSSIDPRLAKQYHLAKLKHNVIMGGLDGRRVTAKVLIPQLTLGQFTVQQQKAIISDHRFIKIDAKPLAGSLGLDFLKQYQALVNFGSRTLFLAKGAVDSKAVGRKLVKAGYQAIPLHRLPHGNQLVATSINGNPPVYFIIDSGSFKTLLAHEYAISLRLPIHKLKYKIRGSVGTKQNLWKLKVKSLKVGANIWQPGELTAIDFNHMPHSRKYPIKGILGMDWLIAHQAIIDFATHVIYVKQTKA